MIISLLACQKLSLQLKFIETLNLNHITRPNSTFKFLKWSPLCDDLVDCLLRTLKMPELKTHDKLPSYPKHGLTQFSIHILFTPSHVSLSIHANCMHEISVDNSNKFFLTIHDSQRSTSRSHKVSRSNYTHFSRI